MKKILIIEDEESLAEALRYTLGREGYEVAVALDGRKGLEAFHSGSPDLIILDLMLPCVDGLEVCRRVRGESDVPILVLTAKDSDVDEVLGLELGADDYVRKPFDMRALMARVKALLRRTSGAMRQAEERLTWAGVVMDLQKHEVSVRGREVHLTPTEFRLLELLMRRPGHLVPREHLIGNAWEDYYGSGKTLDVHMRRLREKIESDPSRPTLIKTVRGRGYRMDSAG